jgi:hypothetical protein
MARISTRQNRRAEVLGMSPLAPRRAAVAGLVVAALVAAPACKGRRRHHDPAPRPGSGSAATAAPAVPDKIEGTLTLDGRPLAIERCRPGRDGTIYVDLVTAAGALRFLGGEAEHMFWNPRPDANVRGPAIACAIPHRSWGGGTRPDGAAYFRGELVFSCEGPPAIAGKVSLDCGDIRPDERASLDEQRRQKREELERAAAPPAPGSDVPR